MLVSQVPCWSFSKCLTLVVGKVTAILSMVVSNASSRNIVLWSNYLCIFCCQGRTNNKPQLVDCRTRDEGGFDIMITPVQSTLVRVDGIIHASIVLVLSFFSKDTPTPDSIGYWRVQHYRPRMIILVFACLEYIVGIMYVYPDLLYAFVFVCCDFVIVDLAHIYHGVFNDIR